MIVALVVALLSVIVATARDFHTVIFKVAQMECANYERKAKNNIKFGRELRNSKTDLKAQTTTITYGAEKTSVEKLKEDFRKFKHEAVVIKEAKETDKK